VLASWIALGCASAGAETRGEPEPPNDGSTLTERVAGRAARGAVDDALAALDHPENRERLARIIASPPMQAAARDITANVVAGVFDGLDMARDKGQLPRMPDDLGRSIGQSLDREVSPAVGRLVHRSVDATFDAALSDENAARIETFVQRIGAAMSSRLSTAVRDELGPALAATLEHDILPAVGRGMQSPDVQAAIVTSMASVGVGAARGAAAGLRETNTRDGGGPSVGGTIAVGLLVAILVAVAFGILFIVMTVLLVRSNRRSRELVEQSRQREERFLAVLEGRESTMHHEPPTSPGPSG
jgi:hypothetical protein